MEMEWLPVLGQPDGRFGNHFAESFPIELHSCEKHETSSQSLDGMIGLHLDLLPATFRTESN